MAIGGKSFEKALHLHFLSFSCHEMRTEIANPEIHGGTCYTRTNSAPPPTVQGASKKTVLRLTFLKARNRLKHGNHVSQIHQQVRTLQALTSCKHKPRYWIWKYMKQWSPPFVWLNYSSLNQAIQFIGACSTAANGCNGISSVQKHQNHFYQIHQVQHV